MRRERDPRRLAMLLLVIIALILAVVLAWSVAATR